MLNSSFIDQQSLDHTLRSLKENVFLHIFDIFGVLKEHSLLAVGEPCVQFLRLLQQPLLLRFIKAVHLQVCVTIEWSPLDWLVSFLLRLLLHLLCVKAHQRLRTFRILIISDMYRNFSPELNVNKNVYSAKREHLRDVKNEVQPLTLYLDTFSAISKSL